MPQPSASVGFRGGGSSLVILSSQRDLGGSGNNLTCSSFFAHSHCLLAHSNLLILTDHSLFQSLCGEEPGPTSGSLPVLGA